MSRERALIKRATEALKYWMDTTSHSVDWELLEDLESYLASEKQDQPEPVAWMKEDEDGDLEFNTLNQFSCGRSDGIPLYLHPAPRLGFVRLSEEEISEMAQKCFIRREAGQYHIPYGTTDFARAIEDALEKKNE